MDDNNIKRELVDFDRVDWEKVKKIFAPERESYFSSVRKGLDRYPLAKDTLLILAGVGVVGLALLVPGLVGVVGRDVRRQQRDSFNRRLRRFQKQKLVEIKEDASGTTVEITQEGIKRALRYKLETMAVKKQKGWDRMWRIVVFDVSEKKRKQRDVFRHYLQGLGFYMLNRSVFVHPYPCFDEVEFLRQVSGVGREVTYIVAKSVETSVGLEEHFGLLG